jgi:hypothetical protein
MFFIGNRFKKSICLFLNPIVELLLFCLYMSVIPMKYVYTKVFIQSLLWINYYWIHVLILFAIFGSLHAKSHFAEFGKEYAHCCPYKRLTFRSNCPSSHSSSGSQNVFAFFPHVCIKSVYPIGETNIALDIHDGKANNNKSHLYLLLDTENNTCFQ